MATPDLVLTNPQNVATPGSLVRIQDVLPRHLTFLSPELRDSLHETAERLINGLKTHRKFLCIPKSPSELEELGIEILGHGEHGIVLSLPHEIVSAPALTIRLLNRTVRPDSNAFFYFDGSKQGYYPCSTWENVACLRDMGIPVPFHEELTVNHIASKHSFSCQICPDLRDRGKYKVHESVDVFSGKINFDPLQKIALRNLREAFDTYVAKVMSLRGDKAHDLQVCSHSYDQTAEYGVKKMFFVLEDLSSGKLHLVAGDLDHVNIHNNRRLGAFLEWYNGLRNGNSFGADGLPQAAKEISPSMFERVVRERIESSRA